MNAPNPDRARHTQAVLLLTAHFSAPQRGDAAPLTPVEWDRFASWLREKSLTPEALLTGDLAELLASWSDPKVTRKRIERLLERGHAYSFAMDKWSRAGLWVVTRADADYPARLKSRLKTVAPPVFFGCGNRHLLNQGGIAVVGSRNASGEDLAYARRLGALAAAQGFSIVSGGARGVDEAAMLGALETEGTAVGVLADRLLRACSSAKYRPHLMSNNLVLVSPFQPEAGFNVGNAMGRNKYIYCLSNAAVVVHSGTKGGTWSGALENLKKEWAPLWVRRTSDPAAGNAGIFGAGARWLEQGLDDLDLSSLRAASSRAPASLGQPGLFADREPSQEDRPGDSPPQDELPFRPSELGFYELFLRKIQVLCRHEPKSPDELAAELEVNKTQLNSWLRQAVSEKRVKKLSKPVRYRWQGPGAAGQRSLPLRG